MIMQSQPAASPGLRRKTIAAALAVLLLAVLSVMLHDVRPAHAAARVDVAPAPSADGATTVTLTGTGFQYLPNAPGGIYIFFGAVSDPNTNAWAPSQGGRSGSTFGYASASGSILLAAFQGGDSAAAANAVIDANGNWTAQMTIPGSRFASSSGDPHAGQAVEGAMIDCLQVQCGVITIGAHGSVNANNESFTPVGFVTAGGQIQSGSGAQIFTDEATVLELPDTDTDAGSANGRDAASPSETDAAPTADAADDSGARDGGSSVTVLVLAAFGLAVLALIAAIVLVAAKRVRERRRAIPAPPAADAAGAAPEPEQAETEAAATEDAEQMQNAEQERRAESDRA